MQDRRIGPRSHNRCEGQALAAGVECPADQPGCNLPFCRAISNLVPSIAERRLGRLDGGLNQGNLGSRLDAAQRGQRAVDVTRRLGTHRFHETLVSRMPVDVIRRPFVGQTCQLAPLPQPGARSPAKLRFGQDLRKSQMTGILRLQAWSGPIAGRPRRAGQKQDFAIRPIAVAWSDQQGRARLFVSGEVEEAALLAKSSKARPAFGFGRTKQGDHAATNPVGQGPTTTRVFFRADPTGGPQGRQGRAGS